MSVGDMVAPSGVVGSGSPAMMGRCWMATAATRVLCRGGAIFVKYCCVRTLINIHAETPLITIYKLFREYIRGHRIRNTITKI